jgi:hypothetical protein
MLVGARGGNMEKDKDGYSGALDAQGTGFDLGGGTDVFLRSVMPLGPGIQAVKWRG